ncbi:TIGR02444 family protein [Siccirubricoccus sp. G192]|uniref:TIGR02444 family protein n=1 Tax=Siccirubricoccus sp. G192 TaxID=2849651 RepID=UPI001C2C48A4|nr:TIGR02444 family protein [Siccirubricoccus sp. G192]MBV1798875.1 TIGR02444 family protein [Siccirubricoccus sp. G192]
MEGDTLQPENAFWHFSLAVYAAPGVQDACLALQDRFGLDVNLALFCAWAGAGRGMALAPADVAEAAALVQDWREEVVAPLRNLRRRLKPRPEAPVKALRQRVAALELEAEQLQQAMLFRMAAGWLAAAPSRGLALRNLHALLAWSGAGEGTAAATALLATAAEAANAP